MPRPERNRESGGLWRRPLHVTQVPVVSAAFHGQCLCCCARNVCAAVREMFVLLCANCLCCCARNVCAAVSRTVCPLVRCCVLWCLCRGTSRGACMRAAVYSLLYHLMLLLLLLLLLLLVLVPSHKSKFTTYSLNVGEMARTHAHAQGHLKK